MSVRIIIGHVLDKLAELPADSVHCCVTSPPYWELRDYGVKPQIWGGDPRCEHQWGAPIIERATNHTDKRRWQHTRNGRDEEQPTHKRVAWLRSDVAQGAMCERCGAWLGSLGLEPTIELYIEHIVAVFREVHRVLRSDGTVWLNLGDSYASGNRVDYQSGATANKGNNTTDKMARPKTPAGFKPKDLLGVPWLVAFALRTDGWYLRSDIIWSKPNPMPESVTDRPTKAHEYLFLLSKGERYYYDGEAIKEPAITADMRRPYGSQGSWLLDGRPVEQRPNGKLRVELARGFRGGSYVSGEPGPRQAHGNIYAPEDFTRNRRSVWSIATAPYAEAHFATFPPALVEPCILAGTSAGGVCPDCGAPWHRIVKRIGITDHNGTTASLYDGKSTAGRISRLRQAAREQGFEYFNAQQTVGWQPSCACAGHAAIPATVLDPFGGSGTVGIVADRLNRNAILIELNPDYADMARRRIASDAPLLADVAGVIR